MNWNDLTLAELWQVEEENYEAFLYYDKLSRESKGDPGNGVYEFTDLADEAHDTWQHAQYLLCAVSSLLRGW
jgi:hypothetical protein